MDVTCSTSSICNLVAISIDRFIAVTQPIKYAKHKSNTRVWLTIVFVWVFSGLVGSPIVLGLNTLPDNVTGDFECAFNNKYFVLFSSLCSFYIPCAILVFLYYRIFKPVFQFPQSSLNPRPSRRQVLDGQHTPKGQIEGQVKTNPCDNVSNCNGRK
ncbi:unnamed protein product [Allacma fusca]|uniref:G-protein coupled receptors family 1 profile domain-containing protein n=1 Tax=Allacma fusca TaxID=39272 RepID=A0A8J2LDA7_9HEXA|nr:unnamed protein product [Allacma fusca]